MSNRKKKIMLIFLEGLKKMYLKDTLIVQKSLKSKILLELHQIVH